MDGASRNQNRPRRPYCSGLANPRIAWLLFTVTRVIAGRRSAGICIVGDGLKYTKTHSRYTSKTVLLRLSFVTLVMTGVWKACVLTRVFSQPTANAHSLHPRLPMCS